MFEDISSIVAKAVSRSGLKTKIDEGKVITVVSKIIKEFIPPELNSKIKIMYIKNGNVCIASLSERAILAIESKKDEIFGEISSILPKADLIDFKYIN